MRNIILVLVVLFLWVGAALAQNQPPPVDFERNDSAAKVLNSVNGIPAYAAVSREGEVYSKKAPGLEACNTALTSTTPVPVVPATPGVAHAINSVHCYNTATTGSELTFKSGTTQIAKSIVGTTTLGNNKTTVDFPNPAVCDIGSAFNVVATTTGTGTTCCANYKDLIAPTATPTATPTQTPTATRTPTATP